MASPPFSDGYYEVPQFIQVTVVRLQGNEVVSPSGDDPQSPVQSKDVVISPHTGIFARLYIPTTKLQNTHQDEDDIIDGKKLPVMVFFHGGAFFVETAASPTYHNFLNLLCLELNIVIASVDYRRAPEHPLPIAYRDSWEAVNWVGSHSNRQGTEPWLNNHVDFGRLFLAGDSAGANIAHNMAMRVGLGYPNAGIEVNGVILMCPYFWGKDPIDGEPNQAADRAEYEVAWIRAAPLSSGCDDPLINPVMDPELQKLGTRRVQIFVAEKDPFVHRGWNYYQALDSNGWGGNAGIMETEGEEHCFFLFNLDSVKTQEIIKQVNAFINQS